MRPPEEKPEFPEYDVYGRPSDNKMVAFSNLYPCNWLQVYENIVDHFPHRAFMQQHDGGQCGRGHQERYEFSGLLPGHAGDGLGEDA